MPNQNLTTIVVVLDRSGSMAPLREATVAGLNQFFQTQRELPGEVRLTLVQFDDQYEIHCDNVDLKTMPSLTEVDFVPRGWTALHDAIGKTIKNLGNRLAETPDDLRPGKVVFVVQTDGHENASREYNNTQIQDMITHQRTKYSWEFLFLGANQDAIATGGHMGFLPTQALTYNADIGSTRRAFGAVGQSIASYVSGASVNSTFTDSMRKEVLEDSDVADLLKQVVKNDSSQT